MKEECIAAAAQILASMKNSAKKLGYALERGDSDDIAAAKKEILDLQRKLGEII